MAVALTADQRAALQGHAIAIRVLLDLYLDSGRYSFWDGEAHAPFDGTTYLAAGAFAGASSISLGVDLGAEGLEIVLDGTRLANAATEAGSPTDPAAMLGSIEQENYQQRRVEIRYAFFSHETGALIMTVRRFNGLIDQIEQREEMGQNGPTQLLVVKCESVVRRYGRRGGRTRSHADQQEIFSGDNFFKFTLDTIAKEKSLYWGREKPKPPTSAPGSPGITGGGRNWLN